MAGLFIFTSNRMEVLIEHLAEVLYEPLADAMAPEIIVVQSRGMERWVSTELARRTGISANVRFPFPNAFLEATLQAVSTEPALPSPFDLDVLTFRIVGLIEAHSGHSDFKSLRHFLADDPRGVKRYQLARRIADLFDQYLVFRPEMIAQWESGHVEGSEHHRWQASIWRELARTMPGMHRGAQCRLLVERLRSDAQGLAALPQRVALFGVSYLPQFHLDFFEALSRVIHVYLLVMNPCREYWADIVSERALHGWQRRTGDFEAVERRLHLERGNRLLASLGTLGRDFLDMITEFSGDQNEIFVAPDGHMLLGRLQSDILYLKEPMGDQGLALDGSIRIHVCHSPMRETEVLQDQLLAMFAEDPHLKPNDIIVMAPNIEVYAPFIAAVFGASDSSPPRIPFSIADRGPFRENSFLRAFFQLLDLQGSRFGAGEVLRLLETPAVRKRFGIGDAHLPRLEQWVRAARICWGEDETTQASLGLPEHPQNTWQAGVDRLLLGYALPSQDTELFHGIRGINAVEGTDTRVLGPFLDFLEQLFATSARLRQPRSLGAWRDELNGTLFAFFPEEGGGPGQLRPLRRILDEMAVNASLAGFNTGVPIDLVRLILYERLEGEGVGRGFMSGGVTFCSMLPMRSIPFKVVCLMGMNHDAYPRESRQLTFDLMAQAPRPGDRSRRNDDKYLFLEALLSARRKLYISYVGQSIQDNSRVPPSVVVNELIDVLQTGYGLPVNEARPPLVVHHPLQAFSVNYFTGGSSLFSFSAEDLQAAVAAAEPSSPRPFMPEPIPLTAEEAAVFSRLDIGRLSSFFGHPAKYLLKNRLGVQLDPPEEAASDGEPFRLAGLERFIIGSQMLDQRLDGFKPREVFAALRADGRLPHGAVGEVEFQELWSEVDRFARRLEALRPTAARGAIDARWEISGFTLTAHITELSRDGCLGFRFGRLRAKDQLEIWLHHLALCQAATAAGKLESVFVGTDRTLRLKHVPDGLAVMKDLLAIYRQGLERPLCFFPNAGLEYASVLRASSSPSRALGSARSIWDGSDLHPGESVDPYFQRCFESIHPLNAEFQELSRRVFDPLLEYASIERAS